MDRRVEIQPDISHLYLPGTEQLTDDVDGFTSDDLDEIEYRPIPPRRVLTVKVKVRVLDHGKPLPYPLMDEE